VTVSSFSEQLRDATIEVSSPDGTIRLLATGRGEIEVSLSRRRLLWHTDESLASELQATIEAAVRTARRTYVQTRRAVFSTGPDDIDDVDGGADARSDQ
jgi:hypothetical protein